MTPGNIIGMAVVKELNVVALTDHNSCKNCPPFIKYAEEYGIIAIPGMELCTLEEVHVICLFPTLKDAMDFDQYVYSKLIPVLNNEVIFGKQQICDDEDMVIDSEPYLLINATNIPFDQVYDVVYRYHGIMIPAHIDKNSNSVLSNLGFIPPDSKFKCVELSNIKNLESIQKLNPYLEKCSIITNSDAHYLEYMNEPVNWISSKSRKVKDILDSLIDIR